jgi:ribosomal protein L37AE/L43A
MEMDIIVYCPECGNTFLVRDSDGYICEACGIWFITPAFELPDEAPLYDPVVHDNMLAEIRINQSFHDDLDLFDI